MKSDTKMLKALNVEGVLWLTQMYHVAWKFSKTSWDWQTGVIITSVKPYLRWRRDRVTALVRSALDDFEMSAWRDETTSFLFAIHTKRDTSVAIGNAKHCLAEVWDWDDGQLLKLVIFHILGVKWSNVKHQGCKSPILLWLKF